MDSWILHVPSGSGRFIGRVNNPLSSFSVCLGNGSKKEDFVGRRTFFIIYGKVVIQCLLLKNKLVWHHKVYLSAGILVSKPRDLRVWIPRRLWSVVVGQLSFCHHIWAGIYSKHFTNELSQEMLSRRDILRCASNKNSMAGLSWNWPLFVLLFTKECYSNTRSNDHWLGFYHHLKWMARQCLLENTQKLSQIWNTLALCSKDQCLC